NSGACAGVQGSPEAFTPESREAADHSTPFVVAMALRTGSITEKAYEGERWLAPDLRAFMRKIRLIVDPEREAGLRQRGGLGCRGVGGLDDGSRHEVALRQPHGHWEAPLAGADLLAKMASLLDARFGRGFASFLFDTCRDLTHVADVSNLVEA